MNDDAINQSNELKIVSSVRPAKFTGEVFYLHTVGRETASTNFNFVPPTLCSAPPTFTSFDDFLVTKRTFSTVGSQSYGM